MRDVKSESKGDDECGPQEAKGDSEVLASQKQLEEESAAALRWIVTPLVDEVRDCDDEKRKKARQNETVIGSVRIWQRETA
jgi:hypothetical protein